LLVKAPKVFWTVGLVQFFCWAAFMYMWTYTNGTVAYHFFGTPVIDTVANGVHKIVLDTQSVQYQDAGNIVGVAYAVQAIGAVIWAMLIPMFKNRKLVYSLSLLLGAVGFIFMSFSTELYMLFISFALIGCAWAATLALPFTILTNALNGSHMGTYLGLFNGTICVPQIVAAALGGTILSTISPAGTLPSEWLMMLVAGILLIAGACCVWIIKEKYGEVQTDKQEG
jgi:maltose/moltooligosaccharide transporter